MKKDFNSYDLVCEDALNRKQSFAIWVRENGLISGVTGTAEFNKLFFGSEDKRFFTCEADAADFLQDVTVNVWRVNEEGQKYASTEKITIHKYLAEDVYNIFQQIFNDPEQFPVKEAGGARFTNTMRHAWAAAIDINPDDNVCVTIENGVSKPGTQIGVGWWPVGTERTDWACDLTEPSVYSIFGGGSVVRAFADYGWGWGGNWSGGYKDFMHFSFLERGW